jgi:chlorobactene glucosyltransferase
MWLTYLGIVSLFLIIMGVNLFLNLRSLHRLDEEKVDPDGPFPLISVLVPARNEEANIATCIESLMAQDYPNFEILVLDDNSTDRTSAIVEGLAARDSRVRLLHGEPLPPGWAGKPHACHQLGQYARGTWLLFTDADTKHAPSMLSHAMAYVQEHKLSLLSGLPLQRTVSPSQKVVIPTLYFMILTCFPLWWIQGSAKPKAGFVFGQFIFANAADYHEVGGHEAVKARIIEDVCLGLEFTHHGKKQGVVDLSRDVSCRMYGSVGELWQGFTKWTYSISCFSEAALILLITVGIAFFLGPFIVLAWELLPFLNAPGWLALAGAQVIFIIVMRALIDHRFGWSEAYSVSHPAAILFWLLSAVYASYKHFAGTGVSWKKREYRASVGVK